MSGLLGLHRAGVSGPSGRGRSRCGAQGVAGREVLVRGGGGRRQPRAVEKVVRLASAKGVPLLPGPRAAAIGAQLGKPPVMAVGVRDRALAGGMVQLAAARS